MDAPSVGIINPAVVGTLNAIAVYNFAKRQFGAAVNTTIVPGARVSPARQITKGWSVKQPKLERFPRGLLPWQLGASRSTGYFPSSSFFRRLTH